MLIMTKFFVRVIILKKELFIFMSNYTSADKLYEILDKLLKTYDTNPNAKAKYAIQDIFKFQTSQMLINIL